MIGWFILQQYIIGLPHLTGMKTTRGSLIDQGFQSMLLKSMPSFPMTAFVRDIAQAHCWEMDTPQMADFGLSINKIALAAFLRTR